MSAFLQCLVTATLMLTITCLIAGVCFRWFTVTTPRLRQCVLFCVMLQGLMLIRMPIELPVLEPVAPLSPLATSSIESASAPTAADSTADDRFVALGTIVGGDNTPSWQAVESEIRPAATPATSNSATVVRILLSVWLCGFALALIRTGLRYRSLCRLINRLPSAPASWRLEWEQVCRDHRLGAAQRKIPEMLVSRSAGPMLVRRPGGYALIIPREFWRSLSEVQRRGVLLHELAHLRRRDVWRQLIVRFIASLHWWNPAAWWCVRRYEEACEWACDQSISRCDPAAAQGLAASLVYLVEFFESQPAFDPAFGRGLGVQSMAAPPLTERVTRLLSPCSPGDSVMKRLFLISLAVGLLMLSAIQFRLVAADSDQGKSSREQSATDLRVLSPGSKDQLESLRQRLNPNDKASAEFKKLLGSETGQIAVAGMIDQLENKYREMARDEAIPRFVEKHFQTNDQDQLVLRSESRQAAASWVNRSEQLGTAINSMRKEMTSIADRLDTSGEVNQLARRMLSDEHAGYAIMLDEFDGRADPIELYLNKALEKILVRRGEKLIVIPTLPAEGRRQIERFEVATKVAEKLRVELPAFGKEFDAPDQRHRDWVSKLEDPAMAAVVALQTTKDNQNSVSASIDRLFEELEKVASDTAQGLVIRDEQAWSNIAELMDFADRAGQRVDAVRERLKNIASELDTNDPMTARFASELLHGVIAYQVAADLPYAEFELGKQIEAILSQALEDAGNGRLRIRDEAAEQVLQRSGELLTACRTIRRYLRRVDAMCDRMADKELAASLRGPGQMMLLTEIRRQAQQQVIPSMELLTKEFFVVDEQTNELTVHPQRVELVGQLVRRAAELEQELSKDDF